MAPKREVANRYTQVPLATLSLECHNLYQDLFNDPTKKTLDSLCQDHIILLCSFHTDGNLDATSPYANDQICDFIQHNILKYYKDFIKLNCLPVVLHQYSKEDVPHMKHFMQFLLKQTDSPDVIHLMHTYQEVALVQQNAVRRRSLLLNTPLYIDTNTGNKGENYFKRASRSFRNSLVLSNSTNNMALLNSLFQSNLTIKLQLMYQNKIVKLYEKKYTEFDLDLMRIVLETNQELEHQHNIQVLKDTIKRRRPASQIHEEDVTASLANSSSSGSSSSEEDSEEEQQTTRHRKTRLQLKKQERRSQRLNAVHKELLNIYKKTPGTPPSSSPGSPSRSPARTPSSKRSSVRKSIMMSPLHLNWDNPNSFSPSSELKKAKTFALIREDQILTPSKQQSAAQSEKDHYGSLSPCMTYEQSSNISSPTTAMSPTASSAAKKSPNTFTQKVSNFISKIFNKKSTTAVTSPVAKKEICLEEVLCNDKYRFYLKLFAAKEHSCETLLFFEQVELKYKKIKSETKRLKMAKHIFTNYLQEESLYELNISKEIRVDMSNNLMRQGPSITLFDALLTHVKATCLQDSFIRFKLSSLYNEMLSHAL